MLGVRGIVDFPFSLFLKLVPERALLPVERICDLLEGIPSTGKDLNLSAIRVGDARPFLFFMSAF